MNEELLSFAVQFIQDNHICVHRLKNDAWSDAMPFDLGLRQTLYGKTENWECRLLQSIKRCTIYHCTDEFGCLYSLFRLPDEDILFLGPLIQGENWEAMYQQVCTTMALSESQCRQLHDYYLRLPQICIVGWYYPFVQALGKQLFGRRCAIRQVAPGELAGYASTFPLRTVMPREKPVLSMEMLEDRYALENRLLSAVHKGDAEAAQKALQSFSGVTVPDRPGQSRQITLQYRLVALNALLCKEAERAEVHPFYLDTLYNDVLIKIANVCNERQEHQVILQMLRQYCERVRQYSAAGYSPVVRNAVYYINSHLKEDLSLHRMAALLNVNRSYLSSLFRRETGRKLTDYVISARIEYAANLILHSQSSVTAAAAAVGYADVSYFTRLFKRVLGTTPAQYCKSARASDGFDGTP